MVCLGNICRSPLAEGILTSLTDPTKIEVQSAGTGGWHVGAAPDPRSIKVAAENGIDISKQKGKQFSTYDYEIYERIYVMDTSNYNDVIKLANTTLEKGKVRLLLNEIFPGENVDVPDPYYGGERGFQDVYDMIYKACEEIMRKLELGF